MTREENKDFLLEEMEITYDEQYPNIAYDIWRECLYVFKITDLIDGKLYRELSVSNNERLLLGRRLHGKKEN